MATASISIMKSGPAKRVTPTVVLVGVATSRWRMRTRDGCGRSASPARRFNLSRAAPSAAARCMPGHTMGVDDESSSGGGIRLNHRSGLPVTF